MTRNNAIRRRAGFTLVELMVAAAVCVLIMAILSRAFVISADAMRELKATGDMMDQLRAASVVMREDLVQNRFLPDDTRENMGLRLSDQRLDQIFSGGPTITPNSWTPPTGGFFRARCSPSLVEGYDNDNIGSYRAGATGPVNNTTGHYLHFTSVRRGGLDQNVYSATTANGHISSPAAEIAYFLDPVPQGSTGPGGPTYHNLIRRQRLLAMNDFVASQIAVNDPAVVSVYTDTSTGAPILRVNSMATITHPQNRLGGRGLGLLAQPIVAQPGQDDNLSAATSRVGDDVLLSQVISFEVKLQWVHNQFEVAYQPPLGFRPRLPRQFVDPTRAAIELRQAGTFDSEGPNGSPGVATTDFPVDTLPQQSTNTNFDNQFVFDTWSTQVPGWDANRQQALPGQPNQPPPTPGAIPMRVRVLKAKITIRVWDQKLKLSRQVTIIQDL